MPKAKANNQGGQPATKAEIEQFLDEQTNVILTATRNIVGESHRKLEKRISSLERQVTRMVSTLEHYIKKPKRSMRRLLFLKPCGPQKFRTFALPPIIWRS